MLTLITTLEIKKVSSCPQLLHGVNNETLKAIEKGLGEVNNFHQSCLNSQSTYMLGKVSCGIWRNMRLEIVSKGAWIDYLEKEEVKKRDTSILKVAGNGVIFWSPCVCG